MSWCTFDLLVGQNTCFTCLEIIFKLLKVVLRWNKYLIFRKRSLKWPSIELSLVGRTYKTSNSRGKMLSVLDQCHWSRVCWKHTLPKTVSVLLFELLPHSDLKWMCRTDLSLWEKVCRHKDKLERLFCWRQAYLVLCVCTKWLIGFGINTICFRRFDSEYPDYANLPPPRMRRTIKKWQSFSLVWL